MTARVGKESKRVIRLGEWGLVLVLLVGLAARLPGLSRESFWLDEFCTLACSSGRGWANVSLPRDVVLEFPPQLTSLADAPPWWRVWQANDTQPPLYYLAIRGWRELFGDSEAALRSFSAISSTVAIGLLFLAAQMAVGTVPALWAALLMALASPQAAYAQEARNYAMLGALGMACCFVLLRIETMGASWSRLAALGLLMLAAMCTHYFAAGAMTAMGIYTVITFRGRERQRVLGTMAVAAIMFLLICGPILLAQWEHFSINPMQDSSEGHLERTLKRLALLPARFLITIPSGYSPTVCPPPDLSPLWGVGVALVGGTGLALTWRRRELRMWWLWLAGTMMLVGGMDLFRGARQMCLVRYTLLAAPGLYVLLAAGVAQCWPLARSALPAATALLCAFYLSTAYLPWRGDWRSAADFISRRAAADELLVFYDPNDRYYSGYLYEGLRHYALRWPWQVVLLECSPGHSIIEQIRSKGSAWMVVRSMEPPQKFFPGCIIDDGTKMGMAMLWHVHWAQDRPAVIP